MNMSGNQPASSMGGAAKLAIVGTIEIAPEKKAQLLPLLMAHRARCLKDEPGTLKFEIMAPHDDDTKVFLCEVYRDDVAFDEHRSGPSIAQFRQETSGMGAKLSFTRCSVVE
jgi:quinol monooxygenase YgiN